MMTFKYTPTNIYDDGHGKEVDITDTVSIEKKLSRAPDGGGYYIYGLSLSSGTWSRKMKFMEEIPSGQRCMSEVFPVMHLQIIERSESQLFIDAGPSSALKPGKRSKAAAAEKSPAAANLHKLDLNSGK